MGRDLMLSSEHGVNPSVMLCFYCQEEMGVALLGLIKGDMKAPRQGVFDHEPCDKCKGYMEQGVILISVRDDAMGDENPYRTGGWVVIKESAVRKMINDELAESICSRRMAFVPDAAWLQLGLPDPSAPATVGEEPEDAR